MTVENKINNFYAPLPPEERKRIKTAVMEMQGIKQDKSFHSQRNGKTDLSLLAGLVWAKALKVEAGVLFDLR